MFLYQLFADGGIMMWPLSLCSILAFAGIIERGISLRESKVLRLDLMVEIESLLRDAHIDQVLEIVKNENSPMLNVVKVAVLHSDRPKEELKQAIEDAGRQEIPEMQKNLAMVNTIATVAPLIGMLGTVLGMIQVFGAVLASEGMDIQELSKGISVALVTSAAGLIIAVPCLVFYNIYMRKIENLLNKMEKYSNILMNLIIRFSHQED